MIGPDLVRGSPTAALDKEYSRIKFNKKEMFNLRITFQIIILSVNKFYISLKNFLKINQNSNES
jgi:hypothetical protein